MLSALGIPGAGAMTRDSCFVEALKDNTASGKTATGMRYNLCFVEGGEVTYADAGGRHDSGTWQINENSDVCLHWRNLVAPIDGCFNVTLHVHGMTWAQGGGKIRFLLRGGVTSRLL
jgi:hypothetical protein